MRRVASMTSVNLLDRMSELSDRVIRPFNASREGRRGSISEIPTYILKFFTGPPSGVESWKANLAREDTDERRSQLYLENKIPPPLARQLGIAPAREELGSGRAGSCSRRYSCDRRSSVSSRARLVPRLNPARGAP